jgi:hypothetical protein
VTAAKAAQEPPNPQLAMDIATLPPATVLASTVAASKTATAGTVAASTADGTVAPTPGRCPPLGRKLPQLRCRPTDAHAVIQGPGRLGARDPGHHRR